MSLLEATTQQVVYGPDGKAYGNPAIARNAGVNQYYREDGTPYPSPALPPNFMPMPGPVVSPMPNQAGLTPYQRIMGQMTPTMNPYTGAGVAIGGYDPALYRRMSGSGLINLGQGGYGGGSGGGMGGGGSGAPSGPIAPTTPEEFAAQSARNQQINDFLTNISKVSLTGLLSSGLVGLLGGKPQSPAAVEDVGTYFGVNPVNDFGFATQAEADAINAALGESYGGGFTSSDTGVGNPGESYGGPTSSESGVGNPGESGGGPTSSDSGVGNPGESSGGYGASGDGDSGFAKGGKVTKNRLKGPDPKGPDEGYGALLSGEYVIKKSAVKKYGQGLLDMINDGKIPAKKMKSLLG